MKKLNLSGQRFGRLLVLRSSPTTYTTQWECVCDCGNKKIATCNNLRTGITKSCGCFRREVTSARKKTHGLSESRTHKIWASLKGRCNTPSHTSYPHYGGRGISYDPRWESFDNFLSDMGEALPHMEIDRIDNDGNYEPSNCRWVTHKKNCDNTSQSRRFEFRGEKLTIADLMKVCPLSYWTLRYRLDSGWSAERATTQPLGAKP